MEKRILRLEDDFWRIRTDTGELADAERNALRAYLDEKGFKTTMIDDNLAIAGELTCRRSLNPSRASTRARRTCIHSERGNAERSREITVVEVAHLRCATRATESGDGSGQLVCAAP